MSLRRRATSTPTAAPPLVALRSVEPVTVDTITADGVPSVRAVLDAVSRLDEVIVARAWAEGSRERGADVRRAVASLTSRSAAASVRAAQLGGIA